MTAVSPTFAKSMDAAGWTDDDGSAVKDMLTCLDDDNTANACNVGDVAKIGKGPDDILRIEFPGLDDIANGDTITIEVTSNHNVGIKAILPYDGSLSVDATNGITNAGGTGSLVFTITTAFIGDLLDQDTFGTWAARLTEGGGISGDMQISEVDSNLTVAAGGLPVPVAFDHLAMGHH